MRGLPRIRRLGQGHSTNLLQVLSRTDENTISSNSVRLLSCVLDDNNSVGDLSSVFFALLHLLEVSVHAGIRTVRDAVNFKGGYVVSCVLAGAILLENLQFERAKCLSKLPQVSLRLLLCLCDLNYCRHRQIASDTTSQDVKNYVLRIVLKLLYFGLPIEASIAFIISFGNKYYSRNITRP